MNIHPFKAVIPDLSKIIIDDIFCDSVREKYADYREEHLFLNVAEEAIFLYEIQTRTQLHFGVVASLDLNDYRAGKVKKHEKTLVEKEKTQMKLLVERTKSESPIKIPIISLELNAFVMFSVHHCE